MFSQLFIIAMGLFLMVVSVADHEYLMAALGVFVALPAAHILYKLKTGNVLTLKGIKRIDDLKDH